MNKNINLTKILKNCPKGWELWSPIFGVVKFEIILESRGVVIVDVGNRELWTFNSDATFPIGNIKSIEIMLYPSRENRDWSKFTAPWYKKDKFNPKTLQPFDKVLVKNDYNPTSIWYADFVSYRRDIDEIPVTMYDCMTPMVIPYNEETKHLCGTSNEAPEYYRYWEDNEEAIPKMNIK